MRFLHPFGHSLLPSLLIGIGSLLSGGCGTVGYYRQAVSGQMEIWRKQVPIDSVQGSAGADRQLERQLELIEELCRFAGEELGLPVRGDYTKYADLGREHVVWTVFAAPPLSLEPRTFWYPVVGSLDYRGFFREADAVAFARSWRAKGDDVHVAGVDAYSTLGWFADPVLNTFVHYDEVELAELIFHELTHQRVFVAGETAFNEALATAVAEEGTRRWLTARGNTEGLVAYGERIDHRKRVFREIQSTRSELASLYASSLPDAIRSERKAALMGALQDNLRPLSRHWNPATREAWLENPPNNALLNATAVYYEHVPCFNRLLDNLDGDLQRFFEVVTELDPAEMVGDECS